MSLDDFRLLAQSAAGPDGVTYRAVFRETETEVELRVIEAATVDPARWRALSRRLRILPRVRHSGIRPFLRLELDDKSSLAALAIEERRLLAENRANLASGRLTLGLNMAEALAASHRMSLVAGRLDPWNIWAEGPDDFAIDLSGIDAGSPFLPPTEHDRREFEAFEVREGGDPTPESDVFALGALLAWLGTGRVPDPRETSNAIDDNGLRALIHRMVQHDPGNRPGIDECVDGLGQLAAKETFLTHGGPSLPAVEATGAWSSATPETLDVSSAALQRFGRSRGLLAAPESEYVASTMAVPERLGRYHILDKLGEGGMGQVYRAEDESDGTLVAVKVLRGDRSRRSDAVQRFQKEARLLGKVQSPFVTRLLDVNEQDGFHYLVLELVEGESLDQAVAEYGALDETTALVIIADVARGLAEAHDLGIVHRDIKPANILLVKRSDPNLSSVSLFATPEPNAGTRSGLSLRSASQRAGRHDTATFGDIPRVKLSDFGLARQIDEASESMNLTQEGTIVGTPTYMAPEQCGGGAIDARTDIYALGATLFHLLAGRPPFLADDSRAMIQKQLHEPAPPLRNAAASVSEGVERVVAKALAKLPEARYPDASAILYDLERLLRGEPTGLPMHPVLPTNDPSRVLKFDFSWDLECSPRQLWPYVANTDRLDRALGFAAVEYSLKFDPARGVRRFLEGRKAGQIEEGEEHPYEWIEGRRLGVYREYSRGPFHWVVSIVELAPRADGGTTLSHKLRFEPRGRLIRFGSRWGVGHTMRLDLERIYRRIDRVVSGKMGKEPLLDPFEPVVKLTDVQNARLDERLRVLESRQLDRYALERLVDLLASAPAPELARIRPIALARRVGVTESAMVDVCLHAADAGLLVLLWDLICPACRLPSQVLDSLRSLSGEGHCAACHADFSLDFAETVEMIFQVHPHIREADTKTYCAAGPAHSPHVIAQVRVAAGEHFELELNLAPGGYRLRGPQFGWTFDFEVNGGSNLRTWAIDLNLGPESGVSPALKTGGQVITLDNPTDRELVVRVERSSSRDDALTAAKASTLAAFRALFPAEILAPGLLMSVANVSLLLTAIDQPRTLYETSGDPNAFATLHEQFRVIEAIVRSQGGSVVKTVGEGVLAAFSDPSAATRAAISIPDALDANPATKGIRARLKGSLHRGQAMAATLNDHLDYFGANVHKALKALELAKPGTFALTKEIAGDPAVASLLRGQGIRLLVLENHDQFDNYYGPILIMNMGLATPSVE